MTDRLVVARLVVHVPLRGRDVPVLGGLLRVADIRAELIACVSALWRSACGETAGTPARRQTPLEHLRRACRRQLLARQGEEQRVRTALTQPRERAQRVTGTRRGRDERAILAAALELHVEVRIAAVAP